MRVSFSTENPRCQARPIRVFLPTFHRIPPFAAVFAGARKALGLNHWLGLPRIAGPLKAGFANGRSDWSVVSILCCDRKAPCTFHETHQLHNRLAPLRSCFSGPAILGNPSQWFTPTLSLRRQTQPQNGGFLWKRRKKHSDRTGPGNLGFLRAERHGAFATLNLQFRPRFLPSQTARISTCQCSCLHSLRPFHHTAGVITSTSTTSRQVPIRLKLIW